MCINWISFLWVEFVFMSKVYIWESNYIIELVFLTVTFVSQVYNLKQFYGWIRSTFVS